MCLKIFCHVHDKMNHVKILCVFIGRFNFLAKPGSSHRPHMLRILPRKAKKKKKKKKNKTRYFFSSRPREAKFSRELTAHQSNMLSKRTHEVASSARSSIVCGGLCLREQACHQHSILDISGHFGDFEMWQPTYFWYDRTLF